ncbi:MAG: DUF6049 family protein [Actinomycetota bacterium]
MGARRALLLLLALGLSLGAPQAGAQVGLQARLVEITPWVGPDDSLRARVQVTNRGDEVAGDLRVSIAIHEGVTTRSQLERTFAGRLGAVEVSDTVELTGSIAPGATRSFAVEKRLSEFRFFRASANDRVYPIRLTVRSGAAFAGPVDSHLIFFKQEAPIPLKVVLVVPMHAPSMYDEAFRVDSELLDDEVHGRISGLVAEIASHLDATVTIAPSGMLLDTLEDLADGYRVSGSDDGRAVGAADPAARRAARLLARIRAVGRDADVEVITSPYSVANLPWLMAHGFVTSITEQGVLGRDRIREVLGLSPLRGWFAPTDGALDPGAFSTLRESGFDRPVLSAPSVTAPASPLTEAFPASINLADESTATSLIADRGLASRIQPGGDLTPAQARQQFLAETATIMLERPARPRVATVAPPPDWNPDRRFLAGVLDALTSSPWMRGDTPEGAIKDIDPTVAATLVPAVGAANASPVPPEGFDGDLRDAARGIAQFRRLRPPSEEIANLERKLLIASASDWWRGADDRASGRSFARSILDDVGGELAKIRPPEPQTITLTSRAGVLPIVLSSDNGYPVTIRVRLESDKLEFPDGLIVEETIRPPAQTIEVPVIAQASGTFPVRLVIETPGGGREIAETRFFVRSTAYNVVAVVITVGAAIFLAGGWVIGASRRRFAMT